MTEIKASQKGQEMYTTMEARFRRADFSEEVPGLRERLWQKVQKRIFALEDEDSMEDVCLTPEEMTLLAAARSNPFAGIDPRKMK